MSSYVHCSKLWKQPKSPRRTDEWIKMMCYIYTQYMATKEDEILPFVTTWIELEPVMLNKTSQEKYLMILCMFEI